MQWDFSMDEVVRGDVDYGLKEFRRDLYQEISTNLPSNDETFIKHSFDIIYELCHWIATGREFSDFVDTLADNGPFSVPDLKVIKDHMQDNIDMLGAILQRLIMDNVEQGLPLDQAINHTAKQHINIVNKNT